MWSKGYAVYQMSDEKWCLVEIPHDWQRQDVLPAPSSRDAYFDSEKEAAAERNRRINQDAATRD